MTIERKLLGTTPVSGEVLPEAVSFDGTSDYLTRSSNMTGNTNSKTFTFSCWIYPTKTTMMVLLGNSSRFNIRHDGAAFRFFAYQASGSNSTAFSFSIAGIPINTFSHVLCSIDLANTSNRYVYLNDIAQTVTWSVYNNSLADFSQSAYWIIKDGGAYDGGRLAHLFLDYTYRDLSVTANRRLFIDAEGKPSSTIPSSPILYLPMTDAATAGSNSGTGGDFTVNGVLATAERGPNQDNCSASTFNGSQDYLRISGALTGATNNKLVTVSFSFNPSAGSGSKIVIGGGSPLRINIRGESDRWLFGLASTSGSNIITWQDGTGVVPDRMNHVTLSCDLSDTSKRHVFVNGVATATTPSTYTNSTIDHSFSIWEIGRRPSLTSHYYAGTLGELYYDNTYIDLSADNPFWDSDANRPNSVRKVIEDTGVTPLIALPLIGSDAGNNLGSGGDFTVNSGPFVGARGGSEFWARGAKGNGSTGYLSRAGVGMSNSKTVSGLICFNVPSGQGGTDYLFATRQSSGYLPYFKIMHSASLIYLDGANTDESRIFQMNFGYQAATSYVLLFCIDMSDQNKSYVSLNGTVSANYTTYTDAAFGFSEAAETSIMSLANTGHSAADINSFYLTTDYIDFTQEANRNKFVDQLGYPKNLTQQIEDGDIPNPHIYMKFDNTAALGTNSGSGGNFTVNGTVTAGADFTK